MARTGVWQCRVCLGAECKGGAFKDCVQRDPKPSHIAAILDTYGGVRTVVAHKSDFKHHLRHDEILVVVEGLLVHEPIAWGDIEYVIARAKLNLTRFLESYRPNEKWQQEAITMFRLRELEDRRRPKGSLNLDAIVTT